MVIPAFPDFKEIDMSCKREVDEILDRSPVEASEYTFTNMFAYRSTYNFKLSILRNNLIVLKDTEPVSIFCPVGNTDMESALEEIFCYLKDRTDESFLERIPESFIDTCIKSVFKN